MNNPLFKVFEILGFSKKEEEEAKYIYEKLLFTCVVRKLQLLNELRVSDINDIKNNAEIIKNKIIKLIKNKKEKTALINDITMMTKDFIDELFKGVSLRRKNEALRYLRSEDFSIQMRKTLGDMI